MLTKKAYSYRDIFFIWPVFIYVFSVALEKGEIWLN